MVACEAAGEKPEQAEADPVSRRQFDEVGARPRPDFPGQLGVPASRLALPAARAVAFRASAVRLVGVVLAGGLEDPEAFGVAAEAHVVLLDHSADPRDVMVRVLLIHVLVSLSVAC